MENTVIESVKITIFSENKIKKKIARTLIR